MIAEFNYGVCITMTRAQAHQGYHSGACDEGVRALSAVPAIARQLRKLDPADVVRELRGYGAWDDTELADHAQNLQRLLWLAAADIVDRS